MRSIPPKNDSPLEITSVQPVTRETWPALVDLFGSGGASNGCWCMYWLLGAEYHKRPRAQNKEQLRSAVTSGPPPGLLAFDAAGTAVGWARLTPRAELAWLNHNRVLAAVDDVPVWSLPCFYVRRGHRGRGVMSALIGAAVDRAGELQIPALEAYPIDRQVEGATRNVFPGTLTAFAGAGFLEVARRAPDRPIMRHDPTVPSPNSYGQA